MRPMSKYSAKTIVLVLYHLIVGSVMLANIRVNEWLIGWDGLYPELNIPLNLIRGLSAGWQEYYGTGLVGGHGFAATLPHTLIIALLSAVFPQHLLRQLFVLLSYYAGGLGVLLLAGYLLSRMTNKHPTLPGYAWYISLIASLYYLFNLGTIQTFYVPLEAFTAHFAALPWLTYLTLLILQQPTRKRIAAFTGTLFLASIQGFIPAVFIAYGSSLALITGAHAFVHRFGKAAMRSVSTVWLCAIAANAYWLGPVTYFTLTGASQYTQAYNNITSTPKFVGLSLKYGSITDVALLRGLLWESNELGGAVLAPWIQHHTLPWVTAIGYAAFGVAVLGTIASLRTRNTGVFVGLLISGIFFFGNIGIDIPPFSWLINAVQTHSPDITQAFRTTFTKFGVGLAFHYAVFVALGLYALVHALEVALRHRSVSTTLVAVSLGAVLYYGLPAWNGALVYDKLFVSLPKQYLELTAYLNRLPEGRIADFPQDCSEGWYNYVWGYFGSGFLWYGVEHPIMARAFDVWSKNNENYYWEISTALRSQDYESIERIFNKYNIRYVLYDQNITHCRSQKGFLSSLEFGTYLSTSSLYVKRTTYSTENLLPVTVYERQSGFTSSVASSQKLPQVPSYDYGDRDASFVVTGGYQSVRETRQTPYPGSYPFSKRGTPLDNDTARTLIQSAAETKSARLAESVLCGPDEQQTSGSYSDAAMRGESLRLISTNRTVCVATHLTEVPTDRPAVLEISANHISGTPLWVAVTNKGRPVGLDITLPKRPGLHTYYYYLPPSFPSEIEYAVAIQNASYNRYSTINDLVSVRVHTLPPEAPAPVADSVPKRSPIVSMHPFSWLYIVTVPSQTPVMLLDQSYDPGWLAVDRNFRPLPREKHVLVNNWQNGWNLEESQEKPVYIVYMPQFLVFAGIIAALVIISVFMHKRYET